MNVINIFKVFFYISILTFTLFYFQQTFLTDFFAVIILKDIYLEVNFVNL